MKIRHNACVDLTRVLLETISGLPGLSVSEVLVGLSVTEKLMRKGTADLYHNGPSLSDDELKVASETLYEILVQSGRHPQN